LKLPLDNPGWAAVLSFFLPGLGQALGGKPARGMIVAIPAIAFFFVFVPVYLFAHASLLGSSAPLASLLLVDVIACGYHIWAVVDAYREVKPEYPVRGLRGIPDKRATVPLEFLALVVLVIATVGVHVAAGAADLNTCAMKGRQPCFDTEPVIVANATQRPATESPREPGASASVDPFASSPPTTSPSPSSVDLSAWVARADRIRVHSTPAADSPAVKVMRQGQVVKGQLVTGGPYTVGGMARSDWIKIDPGQPFAGGFVAAAYFDHPSAATGAQPTSTPVPGESPTPTPIESPSPTPAPST
jgi:hypothetical protein